MPLPPALAARLAKRGIISKTQAKRESRQDEEEVFAESYDDTESKDNAADPFRINKKFGDTAKRESSDHRNRHMGHPGCPNKWNAYHECNSWCQRHWGDGKKEPEPEYLNKYKNMMTKYGPLPEGWREHYDPGAGRHFFWCTKTDKVSWFPPGHPKAKAVEAASAVREVIVSQMQAAAAAAAAAGADDEDDDDHDEGGDEDDDQAMELDSDMESEENDSDEDREIEERRIREKERRREEHEKYRGKAERRQARGADRVDPMDPSAYSDTPRGSWSSGLQKANDS